ncbi:hypothetical protein RND81_11G182900 [Saponaria officinalis]|uniref:rRNA N-glycosylase n=1 Tax=Saponaria officinalis TaxID=3572 RepID=A0AAW1HNQ8_SAPOF
MAPRSHRGGEFSGYLATANGATIKDKGVTRNDGFFLLTLVANGATIEDEGVTKIIIALADLYIYGVLCGGSWYYPKNNFYKIKGGTQACFIQAYTDKGKIFKVGLKVLKTSVCNLSRPDTAKWSDSYYSLAVNICESTRFHKIMLQLLRNKYTGNLDDLEHWVINQWASLSKLWKFFGRYGCWNPEALSFMIETEQDAESTLAIVKDVNIDNKQIQKLDAKYFVVDQSIR